MEAGALPTYEFDNHEIFVMNKKTITKQLVKHRITLPEFEINCKGQDEHKIYVEIANRCAALLQHSNFEFEEYHIVIANRGISCVGDGQEEWWTFVQISMMLTNIGGHNLKPGGLKDLDILSGLETNTDNIFDLIEVAKIMQS